MKKILFIALAVLLAGCNAVDLNPGNKYDVSFGVKTEANANLYLNSFYPIIANFGQFGSNAIGGSNSSMSDGLTDILKYSSIAEGAGDPNLIMTVTGKQSVSQNYFDCWTTCYGWIRRINEFLFNLDGSPLKDNGRLRAEALFFRSYCYFLIMRSHGSVADDLGAILYTDISQMTSALKDTERSSVSKTWDQIYEDVKFAAENLPEPGKAAGRLDCYAAYALMAREMLYAGRYDKAKEAAEKIIGSTLYELDPDYSNIFTGNSSEVILAYKYAVRQLTHSFDQKYSQPGDVCLSGSYGSGYAGPTQEFVDSFDNADGTAFDPSDASKRFITNANVGGRDPRLAASVLYNGAIWKGRALECCEGGIDQKYFPYGSYKTPGNSITGYYMRKLLDESNNDYVRDGSYQPWIEFRYAEIQLIYAECLAHEEDFAGAFKVVNDLRKVRFGRDDVFTAPITDWESALDVILKERAVELCYEGHRFWDLRRTGRASAVLDGKKYTGVLWHADGTCESVSCDMGAHRYPERFDRFPLPQSEISNNKLIKQNSGW
ncbi:MAG: RagB/SusD family nutrient uptake outer membrane protein [Bacteroidales bacterium]|nr:RagB/SusD family nutrient uptake outer membrane protein [Bacteroidales bacterium]